MSIIERLRQPEQIRHSRRVDREIKPLLVDQNLELNPNHPLVVNALSGNDGALPCVRWDDVLNALSKEIRDDEPALLIIMDSLEDLGVMVEEPDDEGETDEGEPEDSEELLPGFDIDMPFSQEQYFREIKNVPLLTLEEERGLISTASRGFRATERLHSGKKLDTDTKKKLKTATEEGKQAVKELIRHNQRLVISNASPYQRLGLGLMDLIQEGNIGMLRAIKKFDRSRGHKFSTYATWWVRQAIWRALANQCRSIRLPAYLSDRIRKMKEKEKELFQVLKREATDGELAAELNMKPDVIHGMRHASQPNISLDDDDPESSDLGIDFLSDDGESVEDIVEHKLRKAAIWEQLDTLPPRWLKILNLRYGLTSGKGMTLEMVAYKFGLSRERIRQIERDALNRLREQGVSFRDYH